MERLIKINAYCLMVTLLLYFTVYLAFVGQAALSLINVTSALIVTIRYYRRLPGIHKMRLVLYWIATTTTGGYLAAVNYSSTSNDFYLLTSMFVFPTLVASYSIYLANKIFKLDNPTKTIIL